MIIQETAKQMEEVYMIVGMRESVGKEMIIAEKYRRAETETLSLAKLYS
mgnify:CR=1 FL=1